MKSTIVHVLSQEGQPYGSERRSCNYCGTMIWGPSAPRFVDNWEDWRALPDNCGVARARRDPDVLIEHVDSNNGNVPAKTTKAREGTPLLVAYVGGLDPVKDGAIRAALGDFVTGMGYLFTTHERDITATVAEVDLPRVLRALREISGVTIKLKIGREWVPATEADA
jgi:hypothetical protein